MDQETAPRPEVGLILRNRYVLESRLGKGAAGKVFKATDLYRSSNHPEGSRHIAIKLLRETHEITDKRAEISSKLRREFLCAQTLSHRSTVKVYDWDRDNDIAFFTMEFLEGETLSGALGRFPPISIPRLSAWAIIQEIGDGLAHAHSRNIAHGDLKPQNIMITDTGELRILGFSGSQADPRDDLYALSCIAYELLAGEQPFQHRTSTEAQGLGLVARRPSGLSRRQWQTLEMGLSRRREEPSISVREWIVRLIPGQASERRSAPFPPRYTARTGRRTLPSSRAIAMLTILCFALVVCASINRASLEGKIRDPLDAPKTASNPPISSDPVTHDQNPQDVNPLGDSAAAPQSGTAGIPLRNKVRSHRLRMAADTYRIPSQEHFAEIHVRRSSGYGGDTAFVWWTESSSAKPGIDYVPQARTTQFLPKGRNLASLFIRIIPNRSRKHAATFYVNIGDPRNATPARYLERTAILLPPSL
jgi:serine/threonine protein kinase